mmetsp:Transcript_68650/g.155291  ORF Transcript_68650/g.155291 Transcript_68650/m.155291 type:complete len:336 (+) Transcript_68650:126-1133(+)
MRRPSQPHCVEQRQRQQREREQQSRAAPSLTEPALDFFDGRNVLDVGADRGESGAPCDGRLRHPVDVRRRHRVDHRANLYGRDVLVVVDELLTDVLEDHVVALEAGQHVALEHILRPRELLLRDRAERETRHLVCHDVDHFFGKGRVAGPDDAEEARRLDVRLGRLHVVMPVQHVTVQPRVHALSGPPRAEGVAAPEQVLQYADGDPVQGLLPSRHPAQRHVAKLFLDGIGEFAGVAALPSLVGQRPFLQGRVRFFALLDQRSHSLGGECVPEVALGQAFELVVVHPSADENHPVRCHVLRLVVFEGVDREAIEEVEGAGVGLSERVRRAKRRLV